MKTLLRVSNGFNDEVGEGYPFKRPVRLLGVTLSSLTNDQTDDAIEGQPQLDLNL